MKKLIPEVDGVRAIAILAVLFTHLWKYPAGWTFTNHFASAGWLGVDLFFVLSGFLITGILWDARGKPRYFRNFYARRTLRIFPLYYFLLLLIFVGLPIIHNTMEVRSVREQWTWYGAYLANFALASSGWIFFPLDITWSLSVEEQFYAIWPAVIRKLSTRTMVTLCAILIVGAPILRTLLLLVLHINWRWSYMMTICRADGFAWGALLSVVLREKMVDARRLKPFALTLWALLGPVAAFLIASGRFARNSTLVGTVGYSLLAVLSAALLAVALAPGRLAQTILGSRPMRHIGKVSYGMYIYHPLCLLFGTTALERIHLDHVAGPAVNSFYLMGMISLLTWLVATMSFSFFEEPLLRLKRHFETPALPQPERAQAAAVAAPAPSSPRGSFYRPESRAIDGATD